jgi:hypothetical protein
MDLSLATNSVFNDDRLVVLAREIAMDIHDLPDVLKRLNITENQWQQIQHNPRFAGYLEDAMQTWHSALNGSERIKVKSLTAIEDWLSTAYGLLHNEKENLRDKTELAKLIARLAGVGEKQMNELPAGEKISITINMGEQTVHAEKSVTIPKIIEHEDHL